MDEWSDRDDIFTCKLCELLNYLTHHSESFSLHIDSFGCSSFGCDSVWANLSPPGQNPRMDTFETWRESGEEPPIVSCSSRKENRNGEPDTHINTDKVMCPTGEMSRCHTNVVYAVRPSNEVLAHFP